MLDDRRLLRLFTRALGATSALGLLLAASPAIAATLSAEAAADFDIAPVGGGFSQPTDVAVLPDGRIVIVQRQGDLAFITPGNASYAEAHVDVTSGDAEQGLLGVVADPDFASNSFIYFYASVGNDNANKHKILRYKLGATPPPKPDDPPPPSPLTERTVVLDMGLEGPGNHNGGAIDIYQGNMYIGVGDTGANATPPTNKYSSCLNKANGKVLRISLAEATLGQPPADNPLVNETMVTGCQSTGSAFAMMPPEKRIFAWGFRNPFRLWVDQVSGKVWVGDVGETTREEISLVTLGKHYGYPFNEGTTSYDQNFVPPGRCMGMTPASECIAPLFDWERGGGGTSIGGRILDGCDWKPAWKSRYIFGDYKQGKVWTLDVNATRDGVTAGSLKQFATTNGVGALRMGTDNALYIVEVDGDGNVSRVTAKGAPATANSCPAAGAAPTVPGGAGGAGGGGSGTAGSSAAGAAQGGGAPGAGGTGNPGGGTTSNPGGGTTAGTTGTTAGSSATGTAGSSASSGGSSGAAGADDSGCGCRTAGGAAGTGLSLVALGAALGVALQRRRRARRS